MNNAFTHSLLTPDDPSPVELVNVDSNVPILLLCEHAGQSIPEKLGTLGVSAEILNSHRGWDIGAEHVARRLADKLRAPLVIQRYSRLVIDANRRPDCDAAFPTVSDNALIPGNRELGPEARRARIEAIFTPMDRAINRLFKRCERKACFSIHSFTPVLDGQRRPWNATFLSRYSTETADRLLASIAHARPELMLEINRPYQINVETDWFIPVHAEARNLPHALIEIRNDQLSDDDSKEEWADLLALAISDVLAELQ